MNVAARSFDPVEDVEEARCLIGEIACVIADGDAPAAAEAAALLSGDLKYAVHTWAERELAVAWQGSAEVEIADDVIVLVEGRLDNYRDLLARVDERPDASKARLLAALWRRFGERTVDMIVGEVAGVLVERATARTYAFRDLCAGRPLHVGRVRGRWAVASEWRPLAFADATRPSPNPEWFASCFVAQSIEPSATPYLGVDMVLPGHVATPASLGWRQVRRAEWHLPRLRDTRKGAYADEFRAVFDEAVRCRVRSAGSQIGVCLSGGLDSTSVIASAQAVAPDQTRVAICMPMVEPLGDERVLQRMVAEQTGSELRWVEIGSRGPLGFDGPEAVLDRFGAPPLSLNWFLHDAMADEADSAGTSVVLSGEDGDGCIGGNPAFLADLLVKGRWLRWLREVNVFRKHGQAGGKELFHESLFLLAPPSLRRAYIRSTGEPLAPSALSAQLLRDLRLEERLRRSAHISRWRLGHAFRIAQGESAVVEQVGPIFTHIAQPWRPRGISFTHPWSDRRLMSFCMALPFQHVVEDGKAKIVLRQAMADRLPQLVLQRRGKSVISEVALRAARGSEREYLKAGLDLARQEPEWFSRASVDSIEAAFDGGEKDSEGPALRVAMLATWLKWCGV